MSFNNTVESLLADFRVGNITIETMIKEIKKAHQSDRKNLVSHVVTNLDSFVDTKERDVDYKIELGIKTYSDLLKKG